MEVTGPLEWASLSCCASLVLLMLFSVGYCWRVYVVPPLQNFYVRFFITLSLLSGLHLWTVMGELTFRYTFALDLFISSLLEGYILFNFWVLVVMHVGGTSAVVAIIEHRQNCTRSSLSRKRCSWSYVVFDVLRFSNALSEYRALRLSFIQWAVIRPFIAGGLAFTAVSYNTEEPYIIVIQVVLYVLEYLSFLLVAMGLIRTVLTCMPKIARSVRVYQKLAIVLMVAYIPCVQWTIVSFITGSSPGLEVVRLSSAIIIFEYVALQSWMAWIVLTEKYQRGNSILTEVTTVRDSDGNTLHTEDLRMSSQAAGASTRRKPQAPRRRWWKDSRCSFLCLCDILADPIPEVPALEDAFGGLPDPIFGIEMMGSWAASPFRSRVDSFFVTFLDQRGLMSVTSERHLPSSNSERAFPSVASERAFTSVASERGLTSLTSYHDILFTFRDEDSSSSRTHRCL